jgi:hypothetical protein
MPLVELQSLVSDGCAVLPSIAKSEDLAEHAASLMITVAARVLYARLIDAGRRVDALSVLHAFGGARPGLP